MPNSNTYDETDTMVQPIMDDEAALKIIEDIRRKIIEVIKMEKNKKIVLNSDAFTRSYETHLEIKVTQSYETL
jgi:hypothetical protein